jgi:hypothetical protein
MQTVMEDIRSCDSWWQRNGEAVYCSHEHAPSFASSAIRAYVHGTSAVLPENQAEVIRQYAATHKMEIVREYSDHGRSGLNIAGREGLNSLLADVEGKRTDLSALLVYGVRRR